VHYENYTNILKTKKSSLPSAVNKPNAMPNTGIVTSKSQQDKLESHSIKSEEAHAAIQNRDRMIFSSLTQRDPEGRSKEMNKSQLAPTTQNLPPPVQIQNLHINAKDSGSLSEAQSVPPSDSEKFSSKHLQHLNVQQPLPKTHISHEANMA